MRLDVPSLPFRMTRVVRLEGDRLAIDYTIVNQTVSPLPYIWAAHPLVAVETGMRIELPAGADAIFGGGVSVDQEAAKPFRWPNLSQTSGAALDLSAVPAPSAGRAVKAFVRSSTGVCVSAPESTLKITCDATEWIGLWMNYGGWSGAGTTPYFNLGIEPTTHPCDSLGEAIERDGGAPLPPRGTRSWSVSVTLESGPRADSSQP